MVEKVSMKRGKRKKSFVLQKPKKEPEIKPQECLFSLSFTITVFCVMDILGGQNSLSQRLQLLVYPLASPKTNTVGKICLFGFRYSQECDINTEGRNVFFWLSSEVC